MMRNRSGDQGNLSGHEGEVKNGTGYGEEKVSADNELRPGVLQEEGRYLDS